MMAEHWCKEHQTVFFKKGKMKGYAHPILDDDGEPTGEWCNEEEQPKQVKKDGEMTKQDWADKDATTRASIEAQKASELAPSLVTSLKAYPNDSLLSAAYNWAMDALSKWSSVGVDTKPLAVTDKGIEPKATQAQLNKIFTTVDDKGYSKELAVSIMMRKFNTGSSKNLTKNQASAFIQLLSEGYMLDKKPDQLDKIEPEQIPF